MAITTHELSHARKQQTTGFCWSCRRVGHTPLSGVCDTQALAAIRMAWWKKNLSLAE
jgi:hypothetical protein